MKGTSDKKICKDAANGLGAAVFMLKNLSRLAKQELQEMLGFDLDSLLDEIDDLAANLKKITE